MRYHLQYLFHWYTPNPFGCFAFSHWLQSPLVYEVNLNFDSYGHFWIPASIWYLFHNAPIPLKLTTGVTWPVSSSELFSLPSRSKAWDLNLNFFCGFFKLHYLFSDPFDNLNDLAVSKQLKSVHLVGAPINHSTHSGFSFPPIAFGKQSVLFP